MNGVHEILVNVMDKGVCSLIRKYAEECNICEECARYYIYRNFHIVSDVEYDEGGVPFISFSLEPKTLKEIVYDNNIDFDEKLELECLKEVMAK